MFQFATASQIVFGAGALNQLGALEKGLGQRPYVVLGASGRLRDRLAELLGAAGLPFIAVPTTAGTGAEVTKNVVLAASEQSVKVSLRSELAIPRLAAYGLSAAAVPELVARAQASSSMQGNPIPLTPEELTQTLEAAL